MRREKAPATVGRTQVGAPRSLASTGRWEKSCLQGARSWWVPRLEGPRVARSCGEVSMRPRMKGAKEQKAGYMKRHQMSADGGVSEYSGAGQRPHEPRSERLGPKLGRQTRSRTTEALGREAGCRAYAGQRWSATLVSWAWVKRRRSRSSESCKTATGRRWTGADAAVGARHSQVGPAW